MKQPFLRICCAFLLLGLITAGSMGLIAAMTPRSPGEETAPPWARILLADRPGSGEIRLYTADGQLMQTLLPTAQGEVTVSLPVPGEYYAVTSRGCTAFFMSEGGAPAVSGGQGWAEGLSLHLTREPGGTVTVARLLSEETVQRGGWAHYRLKGEGQTLCRTLPLPRDSRTLTCRFDAVAYGTYTLEENGVEKCRVTVDENRRDVAISLP